MGLERSLDGPEGLRLRRRTAEKALEDHVQEGDLRAASGHIRMCVHCLPGLAGGSVRPQAGLQVPALLARAP